jgi:hypothetical protein
MTDTQMFTLALAVLVPLSLLLLSNSRVTDAKEAIRADIRSLSMEIQAMRAEIQSVRTEVIASKTELKQDLRIHVLEHHK